MWTHPDFGVRRRRVQLVSGSRGSPTGICGVDTQLADSTAVATFRLSDGSLLTLLETGTACYPRASGATVGSIQSLGNPRSWTGAWAVRNGTGAFAGMSGGGTGSGRTNGADISVTYRGTIDP